MTRTEWIVSATGIVVVATMVVWGVVVTHPRNVQPEQVASTVVQAVPATAPTQKHIPQVTTPKKHEKTTAEYEREFGRDVQKEKEAIESGKYVEYVRSKGGDRYELISMSFKQIGSQLKIMGELKNNGEDIQMAQVAINVYGISATLPPPNQHFLGTGDVPVMSKWSHAAIKSFSVTIDDVELYDVLQIKTQDNYTLPLKPPGER